MDLIAQIIGFVGVGCSIVGNILLAYKKKVAWIIWAIGSIFIIVASTIQLNWWILFLGSSYLIINIIGIRNWYRRGK